MRELKVTTNNKPRQLIYGWELTDKQKAWFGYYDPAFGLSDIEDALFFWYKGWLYDLSDFVRTENELKNMGWDGVMHDTFFSGIVVKFCKDDYYREHCIIVGLVTV